MDLTEKFKKFRESRQSVDPVGINSRVLLIDSLNAYIRAFCVTPNMNDDGEHVGGVTGYLKSVGAHIRSFNPTRVICVFDGAGGSLRRRQLYPEYKSTRKTMARLNRTYDFATVEEEKKSMAWQLHLLVKILDTLPVTVYAIDNVEADDVIAYLVQLVRREGGISTILSTDKDFLQLVSDDCLVYNPVKKLQYNTQEILNEYGTHPKNFLLYRIVDGDSSDNIKGVNGVGKTRLLKNFPQIVEEIPFTIENMIANCVDDNHKVKNAACQSILDSHEMGILARNLTLMRLDEVNISGQAKLKIIDTFNDPPKTLNKFELTKLLAEYKLLRFVDNLDQWVFLTWNALTRYSKNE